MDFLIAIGASIVSKMFEYTVQPVGRQLGYLFHYEKNVRKLNDELEALESTKERMIQQVNEARRNGEEIHKDVQDWLDKADHLITEKAAAIRSNENHAQLRCSGGKFPNLVLRYKQSKKAKEIASEVNCVINKIKDRSVETVSHRLPLDDSIVNKGYKAFEARESIFNGIMEKIRDPNVRMIGIYGMGGVGKTWLANEVARQAKDEEKLFEKVIIVTVSQTLQYEKIQCDIAEQLDLKFDETQNSTRATRLRQQLSQETKILIILDDVWKKIDLFDVGIYFNDNQSGCKILMTSRRLPLFNSMDIEVKFPVEALPKNEATELFCQVVGDLGKSPDFIDLLNEVVRECGGLPLVIKTVACALKDNKSLEIWENALNELRSSAPDNIEDMSGEVYSCLKMSYDYLKSEEAKSLLLLCSMFPEDALIRADDLLMYSVSWGFLENAETMEKARNRVYSLIAVLRENCLLLPSDESSFHNKFHWVKVHDVIRDVAKSIALEKGMFNMESITQLEERLLDKKCKDLIAISLLGNFAGQLPNMLPCPQLQSFLVPSSRRYFFGEESLPIIPDHFFDETKKLRVLNLLEVCLKSPPLSFSSLIESLQTLRLIGCNLEDTSFIGGLKSLKCLDLSGSRFEILSKQIGQLTRLQLLALDFCWHLKVIEPTVISSLIHLEELHMREVNLEWEVERVNKEIKNLPRLNTLYIWIRKADLMPKDLFTEKLKRYEIIVGDRYGSMFPKYSRFLKLDLRESELFYACGLEKLIKRSEELRLGGFMGVSNNICELDGDAFPLLKVFKFESNEEVQCIVNSMEPIPPAFRNLETMGLGNLTNLQTICHGELIKHSFSKLKRFSVWSCERLKNLLPFAIVGQLEEIRVSDCRMIEEIVVCRREDGAHLGIHEFPKLRLLELEDLPKLVQFLSSECETSSSSSPLDCS